MSTHRRFFSPIGGILVWTLLLSGVAALSAAPAADSAPSLTGKWRVELSIPQGQQFAGTYILSLDLVDRNGQLTGSGTWNNGAVSNFTGSVAGSQISLNRLDPDGFRARMAGREVATGRFQGTLDQSSNGSTGPFIMTRAAQSSSAAPVAAPPPQPPAPSLEVGTGTRYRVENLIYGAPDRYLNPRNYHDFMVDFAKCSIRELNPETDRGLEQTRVSVCRANARLQFTTVGPNPGTLVEYDWVFLDGGKTISGAYRQGSTFGPSVGGKYNP